MKAYVLHSVGDIRYEERETPELKPGWVLVRVAAAGICSSDIPRIFQKRAYHFPLIPGHEFCGTVVAAASEDGERWVGKRVGVYPLIPCNYCVSCEAGQYETCTHYDYIGSRRDGAFAEYVAVPVWNLIELPESITVFQGALLEPAAVALHAVKRAGDFSGRQVCVVGSGAIGFLAGQWARLMGAKQVYVKGRSAEKRRIAADCGLSFLEDSNQQFDVVIEAVGSNESVEECVSIAAPSGRVILMGNPVGDQLFRQDVYWSILRKQLTLTGTWNSSFGNKDSDWETAVEATASGRLRTDSIITHVMKREMLLDGLALMRNGKEAYCKVMIEF